MLRESLTLRPARREPYQAKLGMYLFLAGVVMIFFTALLGYSVVRTIAAGPGDQLTIPSEFLWGGMTVVLTSWGLHRAVESIKRERQRSFQRWLWIAVIAGTAFFVLQIFGMVRLLDAHRETSPNEIRVFGFALFLAALHAAHVLGGFALLGWVLVQGLRGVYDHERHWPVDNCAIYWHFLDGVWLVMLATFWIVR